MVSHSVEASWRLYICIPAKSSRDRREESASEVPVPTTGVEKTRRVRPSPPSRSRRQIRQVRELEGPTTCKHSRDCSHPPQLPTPRGNPQEFLSPGRPEPSGPVGNARRLEPRTRQFCGERTAKADPPKSDPLLVRPVGDPAGPVTHHALPSGPIRASVQEESRTGHGWLCACVSPQRGLASPPRLPLSPSWRLNAAPSS